MSTIKLSEKPSSQLNEFQLKNNELVIINNKTTCHSIKTIFLVHNLYGKFIYLYDINGHCKLSVNIPDSIDIVYYNYSKYSNLLNLNF